jgi:cytochrome b6-f complex iron-sulfur subunit
MAPGEDDPGFPGPDSVRPAIGEGTVSRRRFIKWVLGFSVTSIAAMVITPIVSFLVPAKQETTGAGARVLAGTTTDIPSGTGKVVAMGSSPVIVINTDSTPSGVKAYSAVCTHLGCIVGYDSTTRVIVCPCHDGHFNPANGAVISGPPPAPLKTIDVAVEKDQIFLVRG